MNHLVRCVFTGNLANDYRGTIKDAREVNVNGLFVNWRAARFDDRAIGQRVNTSLYRKPRDRFCYVASIKVIPFLKLEFES